MIDGLELLTGQEKRTLLTKAENLWRDLQQNELGGFSGHNRPFYILEAFKAVIEDFGKRDIGYRRTGLEIEAHLASTEAAAKEAE